MFLHPVKSTISPPLSMDTSLIQQVSADDNVVVYISKIISLIKEGDTLKAKAELAYSTAIGYAMLGLNLKGTSLIYRATLLCGKASALHCLSRHLEAINACEEGFGK